VRPQALTQPRNKRAPALGFTMVELIIALSLGVIVLGAAVAYVIREIRTMTGNEIRDSVTRNGRYVGVSLRHDLQRAGIAIESTTSFGTVAVWPGSPGDTLVILHVPYVPNLAPAHSIVPPPGDDNPLPPGGTCGDRCIEVLKDPSVPLEFHVNDLARLQVAGTRRLILIEEIRETSDTSVALEFTAADSILRQPAGLTGGVRLDRYGTYVQKLVPIIYYLDEEEQLIRAHRLNRDGSPAGDVLAYDVEEFGATLVFADGDELERAEPGDEDTSNDCDDIVAVRVRVTVKADRVDPRVNQGQLLKRSYDWTISPRNLRYEKQRL
jgi:type II secretory pathway pseudopilin PulG